MKVVLVVCFGGDKFTYYTNNKTAGQWKGQPKAAVTHEVRIQKRALNSDLSLTTI